MHKSCKGLWPKPFTDDSAAGEALLGYSPYYSAVLPLKKGFNNC